MSKKTLGSKKTAAKQASILSPYLSLREAVLPASFAYELLAQEKDRASGLAEEAEDLLKATRELLEAAGLVHLLSPELDREIPADEDGNRQARLLASYANAGMQWAKVIGSSLALAGSLMDQFRWTDVRRLAACLQDSGEANTAQDLLTRVNEATWSEHYKRIENIHPKMSAAEINGAFGELESAWRDFPEHCLARKAEFRGRFGSLAASIVAIDSDKSYSKALYIANGSSLYPDTPDQYLTELSAVFYGRAKGGLKRNRG